MTTYDDWKTTDPAAEFLGDAEQTDSEEPAATREEEVIPLGREDFVLIGNTAKECVVRLGEICALESQGNYTRVYLLDKQPMLVRRLLGGFLAQLDPKVFVRLNREAVVNLGSVKEVERHDSKRLLFIMEGGAKFIASRKGTMEFRRKFSL